MHLTDIPLPSYIPDHSLASIVPVGRIVAVVASFFALYFASNFICLRTIKSYKTFSFLDKVRWNLGAVALLHAFVSAVAGFRIFYYDHQIFDDPVSGWSDLCYTMSPWTWGFMIFDLFMVLFHFELLIEMPTVLLHHAYILTGGFLFWVYAPVGWGYCCSLMITELSTVMLHFNTFMIMCRWTSNLVYVANGLGLVVAFTHRTTMSAWFVWWIWNVGDSVRRVSEFWYWFLLLGSLVMLAMNVNWYCQLIAKVLEFFFKKTEAAKEVKEN